MVSIASDDLPEPLGPQQTLICSRGSVTLMFFKLCCCAPWTVRCVMGSALVFPLRRDLPFAGVVAFEFGGASGPAANARPVCERSHFAISSGVPTQTTSPP